MFAKRFSVIFALAMAVAILAPSLAGADELGDFFKKYSDWFTTKSKGDGTYSIDVKMVAAAPSAGKCFYIEGQLTECVALRDTTTKRVIGFAFKGKGLKYSDADRWGFPATGDDLGLAPNNYPFDPKKAQQVNIVINTVAKTATVGDKIVDLRLERGILHGFSHPAQPPSGGIRIILHSMYVISTFLRFSPPVEPPK